MIAAGGVGMSALANLFKEEGYHVEGSDGSLYPPVSIFLRRIKVPVKTPYRKENVPAEPGVVVVGNAVSSDNPEVEEVERRGLEKYSLPSALSEFFIKEKKSIVVAGTHGKTTTASMVIHVLKCGGASPSYFVGGIPTNSLVPSESGDGEYFIVEGDEYDSAYFDKKAKFYHYRPHFLILTSIEFDHADIYGDIGSIEAVFKDLVSLVPPEGLILACTDYPGVRSVLPGAACRVIEYSSEDPERELYVHSVEYGEGKGIGRIRFGGEEFTLTLKVPGTHNITNAAAAVALSRELGIPLSNSLTSMESFSGVRRRQEVVGEKGGVTLIDDFAHHPTAVARTIEGVRGFYGPSRLIAVFEPRSNTSRRRLFETEFARALSIADIALISPPHNPGRIPEKERFSPERAASRIEKIGGTGVPFVDVMDIPGYLAGEVKRGDLVLFMSNGDFSGIQGKTLDMIEEEK